MTDQSEVRRPAATESRTKAAFAHIVVFCLAASLAYFGCRFAFVYPDRLAQLVGVKFWTFLLVYLTSIVIAIGGTLWCMAILVSLLKIAGRAKSKKESGTRT